MAEVFYPAQNTRNVRHIRVHFEGVAPTPGTGTASLAIDIEGQSNDAHNTRLFLVEGAGVGADVFLRVPDDELPAWSLALEHDLKLTWTNPDSGNIRWAAEVRFDA